MGLEGMTITDSGKLRGCVPNDAQTRIYDFDVLCSDLDDESTRTHVALQNDVVE